MELRHTDQKYTFAWANVQTWTHFKGVGVNIQATSAEKHMSKAEISLRRSQNQKDSHKNTLRTEEPVFSKFYKCSSLNASH